MKKPNLKPNVPTIRVITMVAILSVLTIAQNAILPAQNVYAGEEESSGEDTDCRQDGPGQVDKDKDKNCDGKSNGKDKSN